MQKANTLYRLFGLLAAALLAVCFLPLSALAAGPVTFNIEYLDEDQYVVGTQEGVTAETDKDDLVNMAALDYKLPSGFEMGVNSDKFFVENGETVPVHLKHIRVNFTLEYLDENDRVVATQTGMNAPVDKDLLVDMTKLPYELPAGYEMAGNSDKFFIENGDTVSVHIRHIYVNFNLQYRDADNRTLGSQKGVAAPIDAEGKVDLSALDLRLPAGWTLAETPGKLAVKDGETTVRGGDFRVPAGVQKYAVLSEFVPQGYILTQSGDFTAAANTKLTVSVRKYPAEVAVNVRFMDGDKVVADGKYPLTEGVQKYSALARYLPAGYTLDKAGDFAVSAGLQLDLPVHKSSTDIIMKVRFMDGKTFVSGGDSTLPEGVRSYTDLERCLPKGYAMDVAGNFMAKADADLEIPVHKLATDPAPCTGGQPAKPGAKPAATAQPAAKPADAAKAAKDTKAAPAARNEVVKANTPAANTSKIIPQTGLSLKSPVLLGVMMVAALAAAALYLFVIRKKLN